MGCMLKLESGLSGGFSVGREGGKQSTSCSVFILQLLFRSLLETGGLTRSVSRSPGFAVLGLTTRTVGMLVTGVPGDVDGLGRRAGFTTGLLLRIQPED